MFKVVNRTLLRHRPHHRRLLCTLSSVSLIRSSLVISSTLLCASTPASPPSCTRIQPPQSFVSRLSHSDSRCSSATMSAPSQYVIENDQPVVTLDAKTAFEGLTKQEQLYAHYLSRASFFGGLIVLVQTSPESPKIFCLLHRLITAESQDDLKKRALDAGVNENEFKAFQVYCSGFYTNMGNYKGFGDTKIVPNITADTFGQIVMNSGAHQKDSITIQKLWQDCKGPMYSLSEKEKQLGLGEKGVTTYLSKNIAQEDGDKINRYFKSKKMEGYITRAFKTEEDGKNKYEIRNAAIEAKIFDPEDFEGDIFQVTCGDYSNLLRFVNENLERAKEYSANSNQKNMLVSYIKSFKEGSLDAHKDGSRYWIKDLGPTVESYIGFIETYRDPVGVRGEFEGFVSMVNKEQSFKFQELVNQAEELLPRLPWPREFEKDKFLLPDFTSLDVLTFAGSGIPAGINIPNYDEIRQSEGFKNVNLGNVVASSYKADDKKTTFVSDQDHELLKKWKVASFEVQVGLHELLGHGSGKLLRKELDGTLNFSSDLINPLTGAKIDKYYEAGDTYDSVFTSLGSSYEECRAEAVGLYLSSYKDVVSIFGYGDSADDVTYVNWLSLCHAAVRGVELYSPGTGEWKQAHSQARFVLLHVMLEAGEGFVTLKQVKGEDGKPDLLLSMDRNKIETVGKPAVGNFLQKLQIYKSTGDYQAAKAVFDHFSEVKDKGDHPFARWRDIVMARRTPRKMLVQANTVLKDENLSLVEYEPSHKGMIKSWAERFTADEFADVEKTLEDLYNKDEKFF